jgi:hypothetical protein
MIKHLHNLKSLFNENTLKNTAWFIFLVISCLVIANLFMRMVDNPYLKAIFIVIAIGLDLFRQYVVSKAKQYWKINIWQSAALWLVYIVHFSIVIIASAGFTISEVNFKSEAAGVYNMEKQSIIDTINSNAAEIQKLESLRGTLDPAKWQFRQTSNRIDVLQKANRDHYLRLNDFKAVKLNVKEDVFGSIGKVFHVKGESLELYVFIVIALLIELALLITSKDIKTVSEMNVMEDKMETATQFEAIETQTEIKAKTEFRKMETQTEPKTKFTGIKTQTEKNGKKICPICGTYFPFKHEDKIFCSSKCRSAAYRNKSIIKEIGVL